LGIKKEFRSIGTLNFFTLGVDYFFAEAAIESAFLIESALAAAAASAA
jgi:hypothetical protein